MQHFGLGIDTIGAVGATQTVGFMLFQLWVPSVSAAHGTRAALALQLALQARGGQIEPLIAPAR